MSKSAGFPLTVTAIGDRRTPSSEVSHLWQYLTPSIHEISCPFSMAAAIPRVRAWFMAEPKVFLINGLVSSAMRTGCKFLQAQYCFAIWQIGRSRLMSCLWTECPQRQIRLSLLGLAMSSLSFWIASSGSIPMLIRISCGVGIFFSFVLLSECITLILSNLL